MRKNFKEKPCYDAERGIEDSDSILRLKNHSVVPQFNPVGIDTKIERIYVMSAEILNLLKDIIGIFGEKLNLDSSTSTEIESSKNQTLIDQKGCEFECKIQKRHIENLADHLKRIGCIDDIGSFISGFSTKEKNEVQNCTKVKNQTSLIKWKKSDNSLVFFMYYLSENKHISLGKKIHKITCNLFCNKEGSQFDPQKLAKKFYNVINSINHSNAYKELIHAVDHCKEYY